MEQPLRARQRGLACREISSSCPWKAIAPFDAIEGGRRLHADRHYTPGCFKELVDLVVPELQRQGPITPNIPAGRFERTY
jgi:hypothetical protein